MPDLGKDDFPVFDRHGRFALEFLDLGIGEAIIAVISVEPGEAGGFAFLASLEESLECLVYTLQGVLEHLGVDLLILRTDLFDLWQLGRLVFIGNAHLAHPIGFLALLKRGIVEFAITVKCELEGISLFASGVQAICKSLLHGSHSFLTFNRLPNTFNGHSTGRPAIVATGPQTGQFPFENGKLLPEHSRTGPFDEPNKLVNTKWWLTSQQDMNMIRHDFKLDQLLSPFLHQFIEDLFQPRIDRWDEHLTTILRAKPSMRVAVVHNR